MVMTLQTEALSLWHLQALAKALMGLCDGLELKSTPGT